jgi:RNA polymerase sigma-70 factor (ECF subfamily)
MTHNSSQTEKIWSAFSEPLHRFILKRVSNEADAEDLLQDIFLKIHTKISTLENEARLQGWVYQIARNAVVDYYRSRGEIEELSDSVVLIEDPIDEIGSIMTQSMNAFISLLPDTYRDAVMLEAEGVPQKEIARRLNLSLSGAKSRVQRGRAMVKDMLNDCCEYQFDRYGKVIDYRRRDQRKCEGEC